MEDYKIGGTIINNNNNNRVPSCTYWGDYASEVRYNTKARMGSFLYSMVS